MKITFGYDIRIDSWIVRLSIPVNYLEPHNGERIKSFVDGLRKFVVAHLNPREIIVEDIYGHPLCVGSPTETSNAATQRDNKG